MLIGSAERLDLTDVLSESSFVSADFRYLLQTFVGATTPYVLAGCDVNNPGDAIGTESIAINIHDSVIYHPTASAGPFFYGLEEGNINAAPLVPELRKNATNFVYLIFNTFDTAQDSRAFWDPDQDGGTGSEFSQDVNTETVLNVEIGVSVATFPEGTIPICKVALNASVIISIQDSRNMLFRLGTGGVSPDPFSTTSFRSLPDSSFQRNEPATTMSSSVSPNSFQGGDKNIYTLKEWMDVVMTKLKELGSTTYWYESASDSGSSGSAISTSFLKSKGQWLHSDSIAGQVQFTEDITSINLVDPRSIIFRASTKTLTDNQVLYADLIDGGEINIAGDVVIWANGGYYVSFGAAGRFANLTRGDWIKKKTDDNDKWLRVEEFYAGMGGNGGGSTPTSAQSILLSAQYQGDDALAGAAAEYTKGVYTSSEISTATRGTAALQSLTGTFFWLAARSDVIHAISNITTTTLSIDTINEADGSRARCTIGGGHGIEDGYRITIGAGAYAGTHKVEVEDTNVFYINTSATGVETTVAAYWAMVTITERQSDDDNGAGKIYTGIALESDTHNLANDQSITLSDTTDYNATYEIYIPSSAVVDNTKKIQIAVASAIASESSGLATLPRMSVRDEFGITKIVQGQQTDIGDGTANAVKDYIGMTSSMGESDPDYYTSATTTSYNAKDGMANYNTSSSDNLTVRAAKLTAMMADRIQDRGIILRGVTTITNTAGTDITATATIDLIKPGSSAQIITLTTSSIVTNSAIIATMNRNGVGDMTTTVETLDNAFTLEENKIILFYRLSTTDIYTWEGIQIPAGTTHTYGEHTRLRLHTDQDRNTKLVGGGTWSWDLSTTTLAWSADAYIQLSGITLISNTMSSGNESSINDGEVLYIEVKRTSGVSVRSIVKADIDAVVPTESLFIFARRIGDTILLGDIGIEDNEFIELDSVLAEINKHHNQLKIEQKIGTAVNEVTISGADIAMLDGHTITQEMGNLTIDWTGATINFTTGVVSGISDNITSPHTTEGNYFWYGIGMIPDAAGADNRMVSKLLISNAASGNAVEVDAPLPLIAGTKKLGSVLIKIVSGVAIVQEIRRLGVGGLASKLVDVIDDTSPQLGGDLDVQNFDINMGTGVLVQGSDGLKRGASDSDFLEEEYLHAVTLTASQTDTVASALTFAHASFEGLEVTYKIKEATTNNTRIGKFTIVTNGTDISVSDTYNETSDCGVIWNADINGADVEIKYTTTTNDKIMRCDLKRFKI